MAADYEWRGWGSHYSALLAICLVFAFLSRECILLASEFGGSRTPARQKKLEDPAAMLAGYNLTGSRGYLTGLDATSRMYTPAGQAHLSVLQLDPSCLAPLTHETQAWMYAVQVRVWRCAVLMNYSTLALAPSAP